MRERAIIVYFDYVSPFAYIASEVLPEFARRHGIGLDWRPIDLLGLSNFAAGLPYSELKRAYVPIDAARTAEMHGVPIRVPKPFPVQSALALRLALIARKQGRFEKLHRAVFRAAWRDRQDIGSESVLSAYISQAGGGAAEWLAEAPSSSIGTELAALTQEAEGAGVFGVPTMVLDGELFWGVNSLPALAWRLDQTKDANP